MAVAEPGRYLCNAMWHVTEACENDLQKCGKESGLKSAASQATFPLKCLAPEGCVPALRMVLAEFTPLSAT